MHLLLPALEVSCSKDPYTGCLLQQLLTSLIDSPCACASASGPGSRRFGYAFIAMPLILRLLLGLLLLLLAWFCLPPSASATALCRCCMSAE
jgi:hypothetical protein